MRARHFECEFINLKECEVSREIIETITPEIAWRHKVVPFGQDDVSITFAIADPSDSDAIDSLYFHVSKTVNVVVACEDEITDALLKYYGRPVVEG